MFSPTPYFKNKEIQSLLNTSKLVSLDLNGLIVDDEPVQVMATNKVFSPYGVPINNEYWITNCVGKNAHKFFEKIIKDFNIDNHPEIKPVKELVSLKNRYYIELIKEKLSTIVREGVLEFIDYINSKVFFRKAIVTSAEPEELEAIAGEKGLNITGLFDILITGADVKKSKPDPEIYLKLIEKSRTAPEFIIAFEDSEAGVKSATKAGIRCIAVPNRFTKLQDFSSATLVISNLTQDAEIIR